MPRATVDINATQTFNLKSLPEGFVTLKRMDYGQFLHRRDIAAKVTMSGKSGSTRTDDMEVQTAMMQQRVTEFEFSVCIVDHNLEDETGKRLNLASPNALARLDPRIGQEISDLIDNMNQWEVGDELFTESEQA